MLTRNEYDILVVTLAWLGGFLPLFLGKRWTWVQGVGLALVILPFARMGVNVYLSAGALFTYTVLEPVSREALWRGVGTRLLDYLLFPAVGLLLMHNAFPGWRSRRAPARVVPDVLRAHGLAPRRSWRHDALRGLALFFAIAVAYVASLVLSKTALASLSANGDETAYWRNITVPLIVLVSATAGLTEEFLFRGILLRALDGGLSRLLRRTPSWLPWLLAAVAQALFFALIHAGYGTWAHVVGPFVFGLGMAWVARVLGVVPAALLHAQVNVLFFTFDVWPAYVGAHGLAGLLALGGLVATLAAASAFALWATRADAVRLLWRSLTRWSGKRGEAGEAPDDGPRAV